MTEQLKMTEVLEQTKVAPAKSKTLVEFYVQLTNRETGTPFYVQWITYAWKARAMTTVLRPLGMKCGYHYDFAGREMSTTEQVKMAYTVINRTVVAAGKKLF